MAKALLLLAALLVCGEAAQRGDDGNFLSFLRGGQTAKLKGAASKMDTQGASKEESDTKALEGDSVSAMRSMEPQMENEYDRPQVVNEQGQVTEGRNNATYQRDEAERRRLEALKNVQPDMGWRKPSAGGDEGFSPNVAKQLSSNETEVQLTHHTDSTQWHGNAPHFAKCPGNIFCDKRFTNPDDQISLLHEFPETRTFKLTPKEGSGDDVPQRDVDAAETNEDQPATEDTPTVTDVQADGGDDTDDAAARR